MNGNTPGLLRPVPERTEDGSFTLLHPVLGDRYHSARGAVGEALHVYIGAGFDYAEERAAKERPLRIFEMGFGSGLNALLTLKRAQEKGWAVEYHAVEKYPVEPEVVLRLGYVSPEEGLYAPFRRMHEAAWDRETYVADRFVLKKYRSSLEEARPEGTFDLVYFDAFAPDTQPELWTPPVFGKIYARLKPGGVLVTYSAKGTVKQALRNAGFEVVRLPGALGKRHMLRALRPGSPDRHSDR